MLDSISSIGIEDNALRRKKDNDIRKRLKNTQKSPFALFTCNVIASYLIKTHGERG